MIRDDGAGEASEAGDGTGELIAVGAQLAGSWAGGTTLAIAASPREALGAAAQARWWIGTAVIEQAAPYTHFAGRWRDHLPFAGGGLLLHFTAPDETIALPSGVALRFDGARPLRVELLGAPVRAFNVIAEPDVAVELAVLQLEPGAAAALPQPRATDETVVVYAAVGAAAIVGAVVRWTLAEGDALLLRGDGDVTPLTLRFDAPATVIVARLS